MASEHRNDAVFERLLTALEDAVELCAGADRDAYIGTIRRRCAEAAGFAAELKPPP